MPADYPVYIDKEEEQSDCRIIEGHFKSPFCGYVPDVVPQESQTAHFQVVLPKIWKTKLKPICLHLAGTGDHFFWRRRTMLAKPLLKEAGIASIILENPFYGLRKPKDQVRSCLHNVSDIFVMGGCLAMESLALFHWCERQGFGPLGVTGISMGGHMASIAASVWPKPIALIPCLSWTTASCVFTQGVMSDGIPWHLLQDQIFSNYIHQEDLRQMISHFRNDETFQAGQHFARNYPASMDHMKTLRNGQTQIDSPKHVNDTATQSDKATSDAPQQKSAGISKLSTSIVLNPIMWRRSEKEMRREALQFMRGIMDEFTHLGNFSVPVDTSLIIVVAAQEDAYVLREGITDLSELWQGAEVRYIDAGHISAFLFKQSVFRQAIVDGFEKLTTKYYSSELQC